MTQLLDATPAQAEALQRNAAALERAWNDNVLPTVAARFAWWEVVRNAAAAYDVDPSMVVGHQVAQMNAELDRAAVAAARMVVLLREGAASVQAWTPADWQGGPESPAPLYFAIVRTDGQPLGFPWLALPTILKMSAAAVAAAGTWILADAWLQGSRIEAEADLALQLTRQKAVEAIAMASKADPAVGAQLADVLRKADLLAASPKGALDRLAKAAGDVADTVSKGLSSSMDIVPLALLFFAMRGKW